MFAGSGRLAARRSLTFVSPVAVEALHDLGLESRVCAVKDTRSVTKADMVGNDGVPGDPRRPGHVQGLGRRRRDRARPGDRRSRSPSATRCSEQMDPLTLLLADSRFPSGSYAHSLGLEQAVNDGLTDVPAFIRARLRLVAEADARFAVEARRACSLHTGARPRYTGIRGWSASGRRGRRARCCATRRGGSGRSCCARRRRSGPATIAAYRSRRGTPRPIALGVVAAAAGVSRRGHRAAGALRRRGDRRVRRAEAAAARPRRDRALARRAGAGAGGDGARASPPTTVRCPRRAAVALELSAPIHLEQRERLFAS